MSILKKIKNVDISAYAHGVKNWKKENTEAELLAQERIKTCEGCDHYEDEPVSFMRVKDERIPEADGMMCGDCGCCLPYKIRQSIEKCERWDR